MNEQIAVMRLPTVQSFLEFLESHTGEDAPLGQWGFAPDSRGELLTEARTTPENCGWIGKPVCDANGLVEVFVGQLLNGPAPIRIRHQYLDWCYGHVGDCLEQMVQLPGGAVFRVNADDSFADVGYLRSKNGDGPLDWNIFVCNSSKKGLCIERLDNSWSHWGLVSMVMRYNVKGPLTAVLPQLPAGTPYGVVWSSVLNFRAKEDRHLVSSLPNGTVVQLTGVIDGDWTQCIVGETIGYVFSRFLVKHT